MKHILLIIKLTTHQAFNVTAAVSCSSMLRIADNLWVQVVSESRWWQGRGHSPCDCNFQSLRFTSVVTTLQRVLNHFSVTRQYVFQEWCQERESDSSCQLKHVNIGDWCFVVMFRRLSLERIFWTKASRVGSRVVNQAYLRTDMDKWRGSIPLPPSLSHHQIHCAAPQHPFLPDPQQHVRIYVYYQSSLGSYIPWFI